MLFVDNTFTSEPVPKIVFGLGSSRKLCDHLGSWNVGRFLIVTDPFLAQNGTAEGIKADLETKGYEATVFSKVVPNSGVSIVAEGTQLSLNLGVEAVIGLGGGSTIDTAKAIGIMTTNDGVFTQYEGRGKVKNPPLPVIAIPTTSGTGSEVTMSSVILDEETGRKVVVGSPLMAPKIAVLDPLLTVSLPPKLTAETGMDALTHAIESYTNTVFHPVSDFLALESIRLISENLIPAVLNGSNISARYHMMLASLLAGLAFRDTLLGLVHALAMPLGGGRFNISHGRVNAILLPYVMEYNVMSNPRRFAEVAAAMGEKVDGLSVRDAAMLAVEAVKRLKDDIGLTDRLSDYGITRDDLPGIAEDAIKNQSANVVRNPRVCSVEDICQVCLKAL